MTILGFRRCTTESALLTDGINYIGQPTGVCRWSVNELFVSLDVRELIGDSIGDLGRVVGAEIDNQNY